MGVSNGKSIVIDGLVLYLDAGNPKSYLGEPTTNLLYDDGVINWTVGNLVGAVTRSTIIANDIYRITSTTGGSFRFYVLLSKLTDNLSYNISYKYNIISGGPTFSMSDWCDTGLLNVVNKSYLNYEYSSAYGVRSTYTSTYRFMDFNISADTVVEIWDVQMEQNTHATPFVAGTRLAIDGIRDLSGNGNHGDLTNNAYDASANIRFNENTIGDDSENKDFTEITISSPFDIYNISFFAKPDAQYQDAYAGYYPTLFDFRGPEHAAAGYISAGPWTGGADNETFHIWNSIGSATMTYIKDIISADYHYFSWNYNGTTYDFFLDGVQKTTYNGTNGDGSGASLISSIESIRVGNNHGSYSFRGYMPIIQIYNKFLTSTEMLQNFKALKRRFGL